MHVRYMWISFNNSDMAQDFAEILVQDPEALPVLEAACL